LGLNENALALYLVLTAHAAYLWATERRTSLLLLAGFFAGSGVSIKYTGMLFVVAPLVLFVMGFAYRVGKAGTRGALRSAAVAGLAIAAGCWPWLAANWWHTGNPVFPLLGDWLGSSTRDAVQIAQWDAAHRPPNFSLADLGGRFADFMWQSEWHNPLLLALGVLTLVFARAKWAKFVAGYVAFYFAAWWLLTHRLDRFWTPALPAMALVAGGVATLEIGRFGRHIARWSIGLWVAICLLWAAHPASLCGYARFLAPYDWLARDPARVPLWRQAINELAGGDGAVLSVGDAAVFDVHPRVYYNTVFDRWLLGEWLGAAEEWPVRARGLHAELAARGIEYVYVHWDELARYRRTYDRDFRRSGFITPQLFDRIIAEGVLTPLATRLAGANVSLFAVNEWEADVKK
jgi:hypothetical protein